MERILAMNTMLPLLSLTLFMLPLPFRRSDGPQLVMQFFEPFADVPQLVMHQD
jgi:hypothetical protein